MSTSRELTSIGTYKTYGPVDYHSGKGRGETQLDDVQTAVIDWSYDNLPTYDSVAGAVTEIPANAIILEAYTYVDEAFAGGTSYNFGLYEGDSTVIDADGIDAGVLLAALTEGAWIVNDGALVGASIGTAAGQFVVAATGTFTAGRARQIIKYITPRA